MLNQDYTSKLLNLEDAIVTNVENISGEVHIYLELPRREHTCPACGAATERVHDYRMQRILNAQKCPIHKYCLAHNAAAKKIAPKKPKTALRNARLQIKATIIPTTDTPMAI